MMPPGTNRCTPPSALAMGGAAVLAALIGWGILRLDRQIDDLCARQQIEAKEELDRLLSIWKEESGAGRARKAFAQLQRVNVPRLSPDQQMQWKLTAARVYHGLADSEPDDAPSHIGMARWYYHQALGETAEAEARAAALQGLADLDLRAEKWRPALGLLTSLNEFPADVDTRRRRGLLRAQCRFALDQPDEGHQELDAVLAEEPRDKLRAQALLMRIQHRLNALSAAFERGEAPPPETVQAVREAAMEALTLTTSHDPDRARALNGLLQTCVLTGDADGAYRHVHNLQNTVLPVDERVRSYLLLSVLEERRDRIDDAIRPLQLVLREFPDSPKSRPVFGRLYRLLAGEKKWDEAVAVLEKEAAPPLDAEVARGIVETLKDPAITPVQALASIPHREALGDRLDGLLALLRYPDRPGWQDVYDDALYVAARNAYVLGRYDQVEERVDAYLNQAPLQAHLAEVLYLDLDTAVKAERLPVRRALRAERFLHRFPAHDQAPTAMMRLLEAYLELGLHEAMLDVGKKAFMNEISRLGGQDQAVGEPLWLSTVAKIAQAYARLGELERANQLFRACMTRHQRFDCSLPVYLDWSHTAARLGQRREALRRLQIAAETDLSPADETGLRLATDYVRLQLGDPEAQRDLDPRTRWSTAAGTSDDDAPQPLRRIEELWLELALSPDSAVEEEAIKALADRPDPPPWMDYWYLRAMNQRLQSGRPADARALLPGRADDGAAGPELAYATKLADAAGRLEGLNEKIQALTARGLKHERAP